MREITMKLWLSFAAFLLFTSAMGQQLNKRLVVEGEKTRQRLKGIGPSSIWGGGESTRSRLSGPGSSPPRCISKCGRCKPCKPVHVPIHPGLYMPLEYYPEAWRCKCGNKLFMP